MEVAGRNRLVKGCGAVGIAEVYAFGSTVDKLRCFLVVARANGFDEFVREGFQARNCLRVIDRLSYLQVIRCMAILSLRFAVRE